ncbi:MAG: hypothetical protein JW770_07250 [Actinobacteria bacterium]|nr:hypothetical protein [Actinomycetota bacterium]
MKKMLSLPALALMVISMILMVTGCSSEDAVGAGVSAFLIICWVFFAIIGLLLFILWIIALVDVIKRKEDEFPGGGNSKTIWLIVLLVTLVLGFYWIAAIIYYFMVMKKMPRKK